VKKAWVSYDLNNSMPIQFKIEVKRKWYTHVTISKVEEKLTENDWIKIPREPLSNLTAGIDLGVNNLMAVYVENGESFLVNGRPLKSIAFYWQKRIADYQSKLNKSGAKRSKKLKRMHKNPRYLNSSCYKPYIVYRVQK